MVQGFSVVRERVPVCVAAVIILVEVMKRVCCDGTMKSLIIHFIFVTTKSMMCDLGLEGWQSLARRGVHAVVTDQTYKLKYRQKSSNICG